MKPPNLLRRRIINLAAALLVVFAAVAASSAQSEQQRWADHTKNITITRDDWGVAHVKGKTDADAVFGAIYAQSEDDFNRVETNYINAMGRLAEAEGEKAIWQDLRMKIFVDPQDLKRDFSASPTSMQKLMVAWADGLNFYLAKHPNVHPRVITHFEPWMALSFTEGSIGGDIETISLDRLRQFYDGTQPTAQNTLDVKDPEPSGSNGMAIAPKNTKNGHALLLINPHTSFFFRSELQMTSDEGLNAYGASTWGQFFIYQGWNDNCGWMHTSSAADAIDEYREKIVSAQPVDRPRMPGDGPVQYAYAFGNGTRPVTITTISVPYKTANGMAERTFTVYHTHHGPVVRKDEQGNWITVALMNKPVEALQQSYGRTEAKNLAEFKHFMELHANSSNNTLFADRDGNIAFFEANYLPVRDTKFDWTKPVDGSDPATDYKGLLAVDKSPNMIDPGSGWVYNSNDWPWAAAGPSSVKRSDYPRWVDNGVESARGRHAVLVLSDKHDFTLDGLRQTAFDPRLTWFDKPLPSLVKAWDSLPETDPLKAKTADQIAVLKAWDHKWAADSIPTAIAIFWAEDVSRSAVRSPDRAGMSVENYLGDKATAQMLLTSLSAATDRLTSDFGTWKTPWGDINRFQRLTGDLVQPFNDAAPSIPVPFASGNWGSLASFGAGTKPGTKKWYGTSGNSFVAVVEFGPKIRAEDVTAGGESGHPDSKHFDDQAVRYATGDFRTVYFYPEQLKGHTERVYHPGE
jgi:acyl-homoserine lactone acylase PvdQ